MLRPPRWRLHERRPEKQCLCDQAAREVEGAEPRAEEDVGEGERCEERGASQREATPAEREHRPRRERAAGEHARPVRKDEIMQLLVGLNRDRGITIVMVTHEPEMAAYTTRAIHFSDGVVERDLRRAA